MIIDFSAERAVCDADKKAIARLIHDGFVNKIGSLFKQVSVDESVAILARHHL